MDPLPCYCVSNNVFPVKNAVVTKPETGSFASTDVTLLVNFLAAPRILQAKLLRSGFEQSGSKSASMHSTLNFIRSGVQPFFKGCNINPNCKVAMYTKRLLQCLSDSSSYYVSHLSIGLIMQAAAVEKT